MTRRRFALSLVACLALALPASAQKAKLAWTFKKDAVFYQEMTTSTEQNMKVQGTEVNQTQKQTFYFQWTVTDVDDKKKTVTLKQKIVGLKMDIDIGGSKIKYDSTDTKKDPMGGQNPLNKFFETLNEGDFKLTLDTDKMKVTDISGHEEFVKKLSDANPQMKQLLDKILGKKALQDMAEPIFAALPGTEQEKGKTWERTSELDMGPIGSYKTKYVYTYEGPNKDKTEENIKVKTELKYEAPKDTAAAGLPFRIKAADLKGQDGTGEIVFDVKDGWVKSSKMNLTLAGKLTIEISGTPTDVELTQKQTTEIKTTSTDPTKK